MGARVKRTVIAIFAASAIVAAVIVVTQRPYANSRFDYGTLSTIEGQVRSAPVPLLSTPTGPVLLVGQGKHGANVATGSARIRGYLIARDDTRMMEVHEVQARNGASTAPPMRETLGTVAMRGEIVDSKCWLGVMNPGEKKVHRACASLCIRGGVPALLISGNRHVVLSGPMNLLPYVAEPVEVTGDLSRESGLLTMRVRRVRRL